MEEMIVVYLQPTEVKHDIYIISNNTEIVPLIKKDNNRRITFYDSNVCC